MKQLSSFLFTSLLSIASLTPSLAQSPRMQLFEYFDNTSIPPFGAAANAHFDSIAQANAAQMAVIKYHVYWGSANNTDPMNLQNPAQPQARVTFYGINEDPILYQDGGDTLTGTFSGGQPDTFPQSYITQRDTVPSPYTISVTHWLNATGDSIITHTVVTKTDTVTGTPALFVVVIEKLIHFYITPGASGDLYFRNVMKEMLPSDLGLNLPAMNIGDSVAYTYSWKLANVYDTAQLEVVSFVQDKVSHNVYQAGLSATTLPDSIDAGVTAVTTNPLFSCDSVVPQVTLYNFGANTITSCTINYKVDSGAASSIGWTGNLAPGQSASTTLPPLLYPGTHQLWAWTSNPNSGTDYLTNNDSSYGYIAGNSPPQALPVSEDFESFFLPPYCNATNSDNNYPGWVQDTAGAWGTSAYSTKVDWYHIPAGIVEDFYIPSVNLSGNGGQVTLSFDVAHAQYDSSYHDTLLIQVSTECSTNWTTVYSKADSVLDTAPPTLNQFWPTDSQWRHDVVDLTSFNGNANVQVRFRGLCGNGNDVYMDNINITTTTGIHSAITADEIKAYPNPLISGNWHVDITSGLIGSWCEVLDIEGRVVYREQLRSETNEVAPEIASGVYIMRISYASEAINLKLIKM